MPWPGLVKFINAKTGAGIADPRYLSLAYGRFSFDWPTQSCSEEEPLGLIWGGQIRKVLNGAALRFRLGTMLAVSHSAGAGLGKYFLEHRFCDSRPSSSSKVSLPA